MANYGPRQLIFPEWWLDSCERFMGEAKMSLQEAGRRIAAFTGKAKPYSHSTILRYLAGENVSVDIAAGFVDMMDAPSPIVIAETPAEAEWCALGRELAAHRPDIFAAILEQARALVQVAHKSD